MTSKVDHFINNFFFISGESQVHHMYITESNKTSSKHEIATEFKSDIKVNIIFTQQSKRVMSYKNQPPLCLLALMLN